MGLTPIVESYARRARADLADRIPPERIPGRITLDLLETF